MLTSLSCTSNEGAIEKLALKLGEQKFHEVMTKEASETLTKSEWIRDAYRDFVVKRSNVLVHEVNLQGEGQANAIVVVETFSPALRKGLVGAAQRADITKERLFNFGDALNLVAKQIGEKPTLGKYPLTIYKFKKDSSGEWVVVD